MDQRGVILRSFGISPTGRAAKPCFAASLFPFLPSKEGAISALDPASTEPDTPTRIPQTGLKELAERCLHSNPYLALNNISCELLDGVLVLRGCLPTYYIKQIAQEAVAPLEGVERIDNQIQVVAPAIPSRQG